MQLKGNTILITGGGSGIGRGLAEAFHKLGNEVIVGGRRRDVLEQTVAPNPGMQAIVMDTKDPGSIALAADSVVKNHPELNVVINSRSMRSNCRGVWPQTTRSAPVLAKIGARRSWGVSRVKVSVSLVEAWMS